VYVKSSQSNVFLEVDRGVAKNGRIYGLGDEMKNTNNFVSYK
jgi:hypothetical protein